MTSFPIGTRHSAARSSVVVFVVAVVSGAGVAVKGAYELNMSDYGVRPPVLMFGAIKVADKVAVEYDFALAGQHLELLRTTFATTSDATALVARLDGWLRAQTVIP